jgi:hypothetical protein
VLYSKFGFMYQDVKVGDDEYILIREDDVIGVLPRSGEQRARPADLALPSRQPRRPCSCARRVLCNRRQRQRLGPRRPACPSAARPLQLRLVPQGLLTSPRPLLQVPWPTTSPR